MTAGHRPTRASVSELASRYQVGEQLATGGMGTIHRAYDGLARRDVAYKRLRVSNESGRSRLTALFEREYNALRQLKHPNIVEVYDYGLDNEGPFYTMELLLGKDLAQAGRLPVLDACRIMRDVASALALLHARRLVHRDVTPANIRLTQDGRAKLIDFGALSPFGPAREIVGTPSFIAPECLSGAALDGRTDLFALGAVGYWALTQRYAYRARSIGELREAWQTVCAKPSVYAKELSSELEDLLLSLLEREPDARPRSAAHVIERLTTLAGLAPERDEQLVAYSYLMHPPLVGRDMPLEHLRRFLRETAESRGRTVLIEGAAGLGRSALLDQFAVQAQLSGANVLRFQPTGRRPARLAVSIVHWLRAAFPRLLANLAEKYPVLSSPLTSAWHASSPAAVAQQREQLLSATQAAVEELSTLAPTILLVDDLQRADPESLALLASLARSSSSSRILLVATRESRKERAGAADTLEDLSAVASVLELQRLSRDALDDMVQTVFGNVSSAPRLSRFLYEQTGGNPGQCMDVCRQLLQEHQIQYALGTFVLPFDPRIASPASALQLTRLSDLNAEAIGLMRLLSVHDSSLSAAHCAQALATEPDQLLAAAEELMGRGLLHASEGEFSIASESVRQAVLSDIPAALLGALHVRLSEIILASGDDSLETKLLACNHLLSAGKEDEAIELVWEPLQRTLIHPGRIAACVPAFEALLDTMRRRGVRDEHLWALLWPLVVAGYWGGLGWVNRHREAALSALSRLSGIALAKRLSRFVGMKPALLIGIAYGVLRFKTTPKRFRSLAYKETLQRFFSAVTMSTATASSAYEPATGWRIVSYLDPFEALPPGSPGHVAREFALATAELGSGAYTRAAQRYGAILALLAERKVFDPISQDSFIDGSTHGRAQAASLAGSPNTLQLANELAQRHAFFKPHVETIKMTYHGFRGENELALAHRKQSEMLALRGGLSWTAFTTIAQRSAYIAMLSQDSLGVLQASTDLERLSKMAPNALSYRDLCRAFVFMERGKLQEALEIYERITGVEGAWRMRTWELDRAFYAEALMRLDRSEQAKRVCEEVLDVRSAQGELPYTLRVPTQQLAMAEAQLGNFTRARQLLETLTPCVLESDSPLAVGALYRDKAQVALLAADASEFESHFAAMLDAFRKTRNPLLIQQCRRLLARAERAALVANPAWEQFDLAAPVNTQDLAPTVPEVTELVETYS